MDMPTWSILDQNIFPYIRMRYDFGRQPQFAEDHARLHCNIKPNPNNRKRVRQVAVVEKGVQAVPATKNTPMNSNRPVWKKWNYHHTEGGWGKDVNVKEPEIIVRARKKLEKDEAFQNVMPILTENVEELVKHNNAMHMFTDYYKRKWKFPADKRKHPYAHVICDFLDPTSTERPVKHICWANDYGRMGVAYSPYDFDPNLRSKPTEAYFFEVEIPSRPEAKIIAPSAVQEMHYHPKDPHSVIAAMLNGSVGAWDNRVGPWPQMISDIDISHDDVCTTATWINSKTGSEFFSAGLDGRVIWWDERYPDKRLDETWLDPEKGNCREDHALPCTVLEYDHTLPTKFVAGCEGGQIMLMMKKGKSANERLIHCFKGHRGRIRTLHRNPLFIKNMLSVGEDCLRIYTEDCRESSIMWTAPHRARYTYAHWIPTRPSVIVASRLDGHVDFWDLIKHPAYPFLTTRISRDELTCLWPSDTGKLIAVGTNKGKIRLLKPADYMTTFTKNDRTLLGTVFERETRREKFLEQRHRELRLRKRDKEKTSSEKKRVDEERSQQIEEAKQKEKETGKAVQLPDYSGGRDYDLVYEARHDPVLQTQRDFYNELDEEIAQRGLESFPDKMSNHTLEDEDAGEDAVEENVVPPSVTFNMDESPPPAPAQQPPPKESLRAIDEEEDEEEENQSSPEVAGQIEEEEEAYDEEEYEDNEE